MEDRNDIDDFLVIPLDELIKKYREKYDDDVARIYDVESDESSEQFSAIETYTRQTTINDDGGR